MKEDRWQLLKTVTWFGDEQREVEAYVEELRDCLADTSPSPEECPECGGTDTLRTVEEHTQQLGQPDAYFYFPEVKFMAPVRTCGCGFAWTDYEMEGAAAEARRIAVESAYIKLVRENRSLAAFKATVDEALNSGDGAYRP